MGKELLSKKELTVDDLGSLQPVQIVKLRKFSVQKVRSEENAKGVVGEPTVEEIVCVCVVGLLLHLSGMQKQTWGYPRTICGELV